MEIQEFVTDNAIFEEADVIIEWFKEDRNKYKNHIVKAYLPLALQLTSKVIRANGKRFDETFSDALFGLNSAIDKFNPNFYDDGYHFFNYAKISMQQAMWDKQTDSNIIKQPAKKTIEKGNASAVHCNVFTIYNTDDSIYDFEETLKGTLIDDNEEIVDNEIMLRDMINESTHLTARTKNIVIKYLRLGEQGNLENKKVTFGDLAEEYGVTKQAIGQQFNIGIEKLKEDELFVHKLKLYYGIN
jgi:RNA polymerase sigma factor (sigma-70 family)